MFQSTSHTTVRYTAPQVSQVSPYTKWCWQICMSPAFHCRPLFSSISSLFLNEANSTFPVFPFPPPPQSLQFPLLDNFYDTTSMVYIVFSLKKKKMLCAPQWREWFSFPQYSQVQYAHSLGVNMSSFPVLISTHWEAKSPRYIFCTLLRIVSLKCHYHSCG